MNYKKYLCALILTATFFLMLFNFEPVIAASGYDCATIYRCQ